MEWKYQEQYVIAATGGRFFTMEIVPVDPHDPETSERKAKSLRSEFLVKYADCDVTFYREERVVGSKLGRFRISEDGEYAVSVDDDSVYYKLSSSRMNDARIRKCLNDIYEKINS